MFTAKEQEANKENNDISEKIYLLFKKYKNYQKSFSQEDYDAMFNKNKKNQNEPVEINKSENSIVEYKENMFKKIINRIFKFLHISI